MDDGPDTGHVWEEIAISPIVMSVRGGLITSEPECVTC